MDTNNPSGTGRDRLADLVEAAKAGFDESFFLSGGTEERVAEGGRAGRLNIDPDKVKNGLGQLVLTLVKLLHELLERQALRRIDAGRLSEEEIERLGLALMRQAEEIERLREAFNLEEDDLNIDLGPLGRLL